MDVSFFERNHEPTRSLRQLPRDSSNPDHQKYVQDVFSQSQRSSATCFITGDHLFEFKDYLREALYEPPVSSREQIYPGLVILHDFGSDAHKCTRALPTSLSVDALKAENENSATHAQLVFVRGHASPRWLVAIGSTFGIDHGFFYDHISSFGRKDHPAATSGPGLPSSFSRQCCLRLTTLGRASKVRFAGDNTAVKLRQVRQTCRTMMESHCSQLSRNESRLLGASLVRKYSVHSVSRFSLEQEMSVIVRPTPKGWVVVVLMDIGNNVAHSPCGEWMSAPIDGKSVHTQWLPTLRRPTQQERASWETAEGEEKDEGGIQQNIRMLARQYGDTLDVRVARLSAFYAISELFDIAATNESEFLAMTEEVITEDLEATMDAWDSVGLNTAALSNLLHNEKTLSEHIERLHDNLHAIKSWKEWPAHNSFANDASAKATVKAEAARLGKDFQCLIRRARSLVQRCESGSRMVVNVTAMQDSQRSLAQAKEVEKLSRLAFVFLPVTFVCGFFGMNFQEFGQGSLSLWIFAAVAGPIIVTVAVLMSERLREQAITGASKLRRMVKINELMLTPHGQV